VAKLRAAVLAAGRGVRMGGRGAKTLFPIERHQPLLFYILRGLEKARVEEVLIVTGFHAGDVEDYARKTSPSLNLLFSHNDRYADWGNFHSLRVALEASAGRHLLVVNSDIVVHPVVFSRVATTAGDLVLAVERRDDLDREDMRVQIDGGRVVAIGKNLELASSHGEFDGVSLLRDEAGAAYLARCDEVERTDPSVYYEDVYARILPAVHAAAAPVAAGEYAEMDSPEDVPAAAAVIRSHWSAWDPEPVT
jgi:choline kinase